MTDTHSKYINKIKTDQLCIKKNKRYTEGGEKERQSKSVRVKREKVSKNSSFSGIFKMIIYLNKFF